MITPAQVSESLGIPASTIRRWAVKFVKYLSPRKGDKRSYTTADMNIFKRIRDLSAQGHGLNRIAELLEVVEDTPPNNTEILLLADFVQSLESARSAVASLRLQVEEQNNRIEALEDWLATPFYKRIGKKPPIK